MPILTIEQALELRRGKRLVFTNGVFDLLHAGHVQYLSQARELGDLLLVGINSDASARSLGKGPNRPINTAEDRAAVLEGLRSVDGVLVFDESTPEGLIGQLQPEIHVKGGDYNPDELPEAALVRSYGGEVRTIPFLKGRSTTGMLKRLGAVRCFDPDPELRWLFCMTHPDDEISIGAWIRRLAKAGNEVYLSWTHDTPVRRKEALMAANALGIPEERLFFHGARDRHAIDHLPELLSSFEKMMSEVEPDRVACGAYEQGHLDHDATNFLVNRTFGGNVFEIPFYYTYLTRMPRINRFADPSGQEVLRLTKEEERFKTGLAKKYPSQSIYRNLMLAEARQRLTRLRPDRLRATERMRLQVHKDFLQPNLPESLARLVKRSRNWRRWEAAMRRFEEGPT